MGRCVRVGVCAGVCAGVCGQVCVRAGVCGQVCVGRCVRAGVCGLYSYIVKFKLVELFHGTLINANI